MQDEAVMVRDWLSSGHRVAFARVINRVGLAGDNDLDLLACTDDGATTGNLVAATVVDKSMAAMRKALDQTPGRPAILSAQVELDQAVDAGLSSGGLAHVLIQAADTVPNELWSALVARRPVVLATGISGPVAEAGALVVLPDREPVGTLGSELIDQGAAAMAAKLLTAGVKTSAMLDTDQGTVLVEAFIPPPHVVFSGEGPIAEAVVAQAKLLGWTGRVAPDSPTTDAALIWAGEAGAVVVFSHEDTFATDSIFAALNSGAFYIGAMGGRRAQKERANRLTWLGVGREDIARIHGPVGLDLGGRTPAETAMAICAEILAARTGREPVDLHSAGGSPNNGGPGAG